MAGWSTVPAIIHMSLYQDPKYMPTWNIVPWAIGGLTITIGAITYGLKFPEKCFRKKFDTWGSSHQIFHLCVLFGAGIHFWASVKGFHER
jgi:channel protein (hemolysin III family)